MRGRKQKPTHLKLVQGNPGKRKLPEGEPMPDEGLGPRPAFLKGRAARLYDDLAETAFWLTGLDAPKLAVWCCLQAEFERGPTKMIAARIAQLRAFGSDLGFDPAARARITGGPSSPVDDNPYFE